MEKTAVVDREQTALLTIAQARQLVGPNLLGRDTAYRFAKKHGFRLGKRWVIPASKLEALLNGEINPTGQGGGR